MGYPCNKATGAPVVVDKRIREEPTFNILFLLWLKIKVAFHCISFLLIGEPFRRISKHLFSSDPKLSRRLEKPFVGAMARVYSRSSTRLRYQLKVRPMRSLKKDMSVPISNSPCLSGLTCSFAKTELELRAVLLKNGFEK